ncbi:MAG: hypothetical protein H6828_07955 [Planctomycetes bacterium]|nr:hypothetical protein [Planctomycetota bacterium]
MTSTTQVETLQPGHFDPERHYYPRALNASLHPLVASFLRMSTARMVSRYCHLHPSTDRATLEEVLGTAPKHLHWSGSDVFNVSTEAGVKLKYIVETNSCPSGQKSFPPSDDAEEGGYRRLIERTFLPLIRKRLRKHPEDELIVLFDKNAMEASGYAQVIANTTERPVHLVPCLRSDPERFLEVRDRELYVKVADETRRVACAFRYVTQRPWTRLPIDLRTPVLNPIVACLAGGRNKITGSKAYELFNAAFRERGLEIRTPESFLNVRKAEVPLLFQRLGGRAVVKVPYLNAGQGIYTIVDQAELDAFMEKDHPYDAFIVQQLVGNFPWSSSSSHGKVFHIGTVPDKQERVYVFDMRMMVSWQDHEYRPVAMYARRARLPVTSAPPEGSDSWTVLGTNLSKRVTDEQWDTEPSRLLMMDRKDFQQLGLGLDDLIDAYIQAVMANRAIDDLAQQLKKRGGGLKRDLFRSLVDDAELLSEIREDAPAPSKGSTP